MTILRLTIPLSLFLLLLPQPLSSQPVRERRITHTSYSDFVPGWCPTDQAPVVELSGAVSAQTTSYGGRALPKPQLDNEVEFREFPQPGGLFAISDAPFEVDTLWQYRRTGTSRTLQWRRWGRLPVSDTPRWLVIAHGSLWITGGGAGGSTSVYRTDANASTSDWSVAATLPRGTVPTDFLLTAEDRLAIPARNQNGSEVTLLGDFTADGKSISLSEGRMRSRRFGSRDARPPGVFMNTFSLSASARVTRLEWTTLEGSETGIRLRYRCSPADNQPYGGWSRLRRRSPIHVGRVCKNLEYQILFPTRVRGFASVDTVTLVYEEPQEEIAETPGGQEAGGTGGGDSEESADSSVAEDTETESRTQIAAAEDAGAEDSSGAVPENAADSQSAPGAEDASASSEQRETATKNTPPTSNQPGESSTPDAPPTGQPVQATQESPAASEGTQEQAPSGRPQAAGQAGEVPAESVSPSPSTSQDNERGTPGAGAPEPGGDAPGAGESPSGASVGGAPGGGAGGTGAAGNSSGGAAAGGGGGAAGLGGVADAEGDGAGMAPGSGVTEPGGSINETEGAESDVSGETGGVASGGGDTAGGTAGGDAGNKGGSGGGRNAGGGMGDENNSLLFSEREREAGDNLISASSALDATTSLYSISEGGWIPGADLLKTEDGSWRPIWPWVAGIAAAGALWWMMARRRKQRRKRTEVVRMLSTPRPTRDSLDSRLDRYIENDDFSFDREGGRGRNRNRHSRNDATLDPTQWEMSTPSSPVSFAPTEEPLRPPPTSEKPKERRRNPIVGGRAQRQAFPGPEESLNPQRPAAPARSSFFGLGLPPFFYLFRRQR